MKDFSVFYEQLKVLFDEELYEDVKLLCDLLIGYIESSSLSSCADPKDKYMIYYYYGNSAFHLKEYKLAESLLNKSLQINKSNLKAKFKTSVAPVGIFILLLSSKEGFK
jgi:tetratricopeptide (TPR) repeat protein